MIQPARAFDPSKESVNTDAEVSPEELAERPAPCLR